MIPARLSFRFEFTPVPSWGSVFVYMVPVQNLIPERVIPVRVHPGSCTGAKFSLRNENAFRYHVNAVRLFVPAWNHSPGSLERVAHACVYLITRRPTSRALTIWMKKTGCSSRKINGTVHSNGNFPEKKYYLPRYYFFLGLTVSTGIFCTICSRC